MNGKYPSVKNISDQERILVVREIFSTITGKYDFLNRFLSLRRDVYWRRFTARKMRFFDTYRFLDVACGTGDLSMAAACHHPKITVTGLDFVPAMVEAARDKALKNKLQNRVAILQGDATDLPFPDDVFDVAGMAFGIRNIPDRGRALSEMLRVVVPGGQVMVLEMTHMQNRFLKGLYHIYLNVILPALARLFSRNPAAYHYLADSIMNFPKPDEFAKMMEETGMVRVEKYSLTFGVAWLHIGTKAGKPTKKGPLGP